MAKLTALKANVALLAPRLGYAPGDSRAADRQRSAQQPWRQWYKTARWGALRQAVLARDHYTCQRTGALCLGKPPAPDSPVVNHKRPHRGDPKLFWDIGNLETVTKAVHDSLIQKEEQSIPHGRWD
jgi:5-methylcytosine-specific restriction protein A